MATVSLFKVVSLPEEKIVYVGMTPFHVNDKNDLADRYRWDLRPINSKLYERTQWFTGERFKMDVAISDSYDDVISSLSSNGDIQMAFVSQYLFHQHKADTLIQHIGFKIEDGKDSYNSMIIWKKGSRKMGSDTLADIKNYLKDPRSTIILGPDASVSSHILPEIFLQPDSKRVKQMGRTKMLDRIRNSRGSEIVLGALSDEDFDRLDNMEKAMFDTYVIPHKIPYDAVFVNKFWWESLDPCEQETILGSMRYCSRDSQGIRLVDSTLKKKYCEMCIESDKFGKFLNDNGAL